ncbi:MAG: FAD-binding and (Fe-S)-binding domain-containing protein [Burkholderiaceae bacterium]
MNARSPHNPSRRALFQGFQGSSLGSDWIARLRREVQGEVYSDLPARGRYATDASIYQIMPLAVAVPRTTVDLRVALDVARDAGVPVLMRGAGTSQCGQTVGEALVIDQSVHLRGMRAPDLDRQTVWVEPGMVLDHLNQALKPHGLWFPVDVSTAAQCTIGGMAGNNSCGSRSLAYGNMVHNVRSIDAILDDGTCARFEGFGDGQPMTLGSRRLSDLVSRLHQIADQVRSDMGALWPKVMRRVGGYNLDIFHPQSERPYTKDGSVNLAHLLVGSEGTLASFEGLELALVPIPRHKRLGVVNFPSFQRAMEMTEAIVALKPVAVELVDRTMIELCRFNPVFAPVISRALVSPDGRATEALLLVEFAGDEASILDERLRALDTLVADHGLPGWVVPLVQPAEQAALWEVRKAGLNIMMSLRGDGKPISFIEDCAVPLAHLAEYTAALTEVFARHGTQGTWYAHASVGTLHVRPILDLRRDGAQKMRAIAQEASELVRRFKGAFSGEHGDGLVRSEWVSWQFGPRLTRAFEDVKDAFDPQNRLNPGKIVRSTRMDDRHLFRFSPSYRVLPIRPALDWSEWNVDNDPARPSAPGGLGVYVGPAGSGQDPAHGLAKAVEMCNNNGHCRKFDAGTMCPSYRVTRQEQHVVRGRANTLRLALSGQIPGGLVSDAVQEALSLCVSCKGCQRECPTGVDMSRMKLEAQYARGLAYGWPLRDRLLVALPKLSAWMRTWPGLRLLPILRDRIPGLAGLLEPLIGIARTRPMQQWAPRRARLSLNTLTSVPLTQADLVLWVDSLTEAYHPDRIALAHRLMTRQGLRVGLVGALRGQNLCCGRTALSVGAIDEAKRRAAELRQALAPAIERGIPIVGLEPSCLLSLRDEWKAMGFGEGVKLFEEWWVEAWDRKQIQLAPISQPTPVALHGHCHQKAAGAVPAITRALESVGYVVTPITSSCCGMAGAFGLRPENQDISKAMAELSLAPAIRALPPDTLVVADGLSCQHQISDLTPREALHAVEALALALGESLDNA